jgi:predicted metal-dependent HD superfamily phosphohydrolase
MTDLRARWDRLARALDIPPVIGEEVWQTINAAYSEPHRHYHTLRHIESVTAQCESLRRRFRAPDTAQLALLFHDVVYDPARPDNETLSAALLRDRLGDHIDAAVMTSACAMIEATKQHNAGPDPDSNLLLDIDMSILGADWPDYLAYARGVAREYLPVYGAEAYATGRVTLFLTPTLEKPHLFLTEPFAALEAPARKNLRDEAALWSSGSFDSAKN